MHEEGGTEPTIALLRRLDADARLTPGHDLGFLRFEPYAACALALHEGTLMLDMSAVICTQSFQQRDA